MNVASLYTALCMCILLVAIPFINAIFDYLSWGWTRIFLRSAATAGRSAVALVKLLGGLLIDYIIAMACLVGLAFCSGVILQFGNRLLLWFGVKPVAWEANILLAAQNPFTDGLLVIGTLITTLVPTAIHLVYGLFAICAVALPNSKAMAARITDNMTQGARHAVARHYLSRKYWLIPIGLGVAIGLGAFTYWILAMLSTKGYTLTWLALCGASLVDGNACPAFMPTRPPIPTPGALPGPLSL